MTKMSIHPLYNYPLNTLPLKGVIKKGPFYIRFDIDGPK